MDIETESEMGGAKKCQIHAPKNSSAVFLAFFACKQNERLYDSNK